MPLVFDRRDELAGQPGCHALIVGVSDYDNLGAKGKDPPGAFKLFKLTSSAMTGLKIFRWLEAHKDSLAVKLASCRLLLAPSPEEIAAEPELAGMKHNCAFANVRKEMQAWRDDCSDSPHSLALFYFSGHGIQRTGEDAILLLQDFDFSPAIPLTGTVSINNVFNGMAPGSSVPGIARSQLYFVDACREFPEELLGFDTQNHGMAFNIHLGTAKDDRSAPIFFAAIPGTRAYGIIGKSSVFANALIDCLELAATPREDDAGNIVYDVGSDGLEDCLVRYFEALTSEQKQDQEISPGGGLAKNVLIHRLAKAPDIPVTVDLIPIERFDKVSFKFDSGNGLPVTHLRTAPPAAPVVVKLPLGTYSMEVKPDKAMDLKFQKMQPINPPSFTWKVRAT